MADMEVAMAQIVRSGRNDHHEQRDCAGQPGQPPSRESRDVTAMRGYRQESLIHEMVTMLCKLN
jgi:hypothetical protein